MAPVTIHSEPKKIKCHCFHFFPKAMAPHSSPLAWKIPWTEEPGRLQSMGWQIVGHDWATFPSFLSVCHEVMGPDYSAKKRIWISDNEVYEPRAYYTEWVKVLVTQLYLTLCKPRNYSPPGSSVYGILQAEYRNGLPFLSPGDLPNPGIKPGSPTLQQIVNHLSHHRVK